jgi:hypothetical protein
MLFVFWLLHCIHFCAFYILLYYQVLDLLQRVYVAQVFHDRLRRVSLKLSMLAESKILVKVDIGAEYFFDIQVEYM